MLSIQYCFPNDEVSNAIQLAYIYICELLNIQIFIIGTPFTDTFPCLIFYAIFWEEDCFYFSNFCQLHSIICSFAAKMFQ